jgi:RNA polymerase sigma factor (sigma-70 family)
MHTTYTSPDQVETHLVKHHDAFLAFVRRRVADPDLAADVLQDSLLKALRARDTIRRDENVVAWFYRILRRTIIDVYRRRAANARMLEAFQRETDVFATEEEKSAACRCLKLLLPTLKPEYATVLQQVDLAGHSPETVAKKLGVTANNLKVRLHRARRQLRRRLLEACQSCATGCNDCDCEH